jgi:hypothetical protein
VVQGILWHIIASKSTDLRKDYGLELPEMVSRFKEDLKQAWQYIGQRGVYSSRDEQDEAMWHVLMFRDAVMETILDESRPSPVQNHGYINSRCTFAMSPSTRIISP